MAPFGLILYVLGILCLQVKTAAAAAQLIRHEQRASVMEDSNKTRVATAQLLRHEHGKSGHRTHHNKGDSPQALMRKAKPGNSAARVAHEVVVTSHGVVSPPAPTAMTLGSIRKDADMASVLQVNASNGGATWLDLFDLVTKQSSTTHGGIANRAVDGNKADKWADGSCTHTKNEDAWWSVDLESEYTVSAVEVTNRGDCCSGRLSGAQVWVSDKDADSYGDGTKCATISSVGAGKTKEVACSAAGTKVWIHVNNILTLCEVRIKAEPVAVVVAAEKDRARLGFLGPHVITVLATVFAGFVSMSHS